MDRLTWLDQRRTAVVANYDQDAATHDNHGYPPRRDKTGCPAAPRNAPCGTGLHFPMVATAGHRVLAPTNRRECWPKPGARGIAAVLHQARLQDLSHDGEFDVILTIDSMEHIPPEDWPRALANLHRAARRGGLLYLTVEEIIEQVIEDAFATLTRRGLKAARGEVIDGNVDGYHYPGRGQVTAWFKAAGLHILDEGFQQEDSWGYLQVTCHSLTLCMSGKNHP